MTETPDFANPPIVELILGAQFSALTKLRAGHFGKFWNELGSDWTDPEDGPLLEDHFELFDYPKWSSSAGLQLRLEPIRLPGRFLLGHKNKDRLLQIQATRFHLNWRKREDFYPSYKRLVAEFENMFARFAAFAEKAGLGELALNQWELTYIDAFPKEEYWHTPADWSTFLPGLFGKLFPTDELGIRLEYRASQWSYEIQPKRGRLHITAHPGCVGEDKQDALLLVITARGPIGKGGAANLRAGLDLGHDAAIRAFLRVTSEEAKERWRQKP
jgi:uncharacterized protein (TIGR04255 family)